MVTEYKEPFICRSRAINNINRYKTQCYLNELMAEEVALQKRLNFLKEQKEKAQNMLTLL